MQALTDAHRTATTAAPAGFNLWPFAPLTPWQLADRALAELALRARLRGRAEPLLPIGEARELSLAELTPADRAALIEAATAAAEALA